MRVYKCVILLWIWCLIFLHAETAKPNILLITVDDMGWDSVGVYGCQLQEITPNIDKLATEGMRFKHAYVQASNCSPSRNVFQTGLYPHSSGMRGFFYVDSQRKTLPEMLKENAYTTAVLNKPADTSLSGNFDKYWDYWKILKGAEKRGAVVYEKEFKTYLDQKNEKPFYCVINIADPHKPFFNDLKSVKSGYDKYKPSKIFKKNEIDVPPFLPDLPAIKQEITNYYNSVKRADDCVGSILNILKEKQIEKNTVVIFISDHGMPLPFAKSFLNQDGIRIPWIVKWPGKVKASSIDQEHMVSAIDFTPTILDIAQIKKPDYLQGSSTIGLLNGNKEKREYVFSEFNENAGGTPRPSRGLMSKKYTYIFNAWSTGKHPFKCSAASHKSFKTMLAAVNKNEEIKSRLDFFNHRSVEELYDNEKDPHALNNLAGKEEYKDIIKSMRKEMSTWMQKTDDYMLPVYQKLEDKNALLEFMNKEEKLAQKRCETLQWKRFKNNAGGTGKNTALFQLN